MADVLASVWLYANTLSSTEQWSTYTLVVPRRNIFARIALSVFVPAVHSDPIGSGAGARIIKYSFFQEPDIVQEVVLPDDWNENSIFIDNCASITFGLAVKVAWGYAEAAVFSL